jgi:ferritin-like metal-binding protein YciE
MTSNTAHDLLIIGLRNAHAMERQAQELMERQIQRTDDFPQLKARLKEHLAETKEQLSRLEECLEKCGESRSMVKDVALATMANLAALGHAIAGDEILKNTFANNAFENYEIAAYKSLITLAESAGVAIKQVLTRSLREEERMAKWVDSHVEQITLDFLKLEERQAA